MMESESNSCGFDREKVRQLVGVVVRLNGVFGALKHINTCHTWQIKT